MLKLIGAALTAAFLVTTSAATGAEKPKDPDIIHIGALFAMTGKTSYYGTVMSQGMKQAIVMEFESQDALRKYENSAAQKWWYDLYLPIREESATHDISN